VTAYAILAAVPAVPAPALAALRQAAPPGGTGTAPASPLLGVNRIVDRLMAPLKVDWAIADNRNHNLTRSRSSVSFSRHGPSSGFVTITRMANTKTVPTFFGHHSATGLHS
jgi:hypothetical protein